MINKCSNATIPTKIAAIISIPFYPLSVISVLYYFHCEFYQLRNDSLRRLLYRSKEAYLVHSGKFQSGLTNTIAFFKLLTKTVDISIIDTSTNIHLFLVLQVFVQVSLFCFSSSKFIHNNSSNF